MKNFEAALQYVDDLRISVVPIICGTKQPARKWKPFRSRFPTEEELKNWFLRSNHDIAAVCGRLSNLTVLDADSPGAEDWIAQNVTTGRILRSKSKGLHYHFEFTDYPNRQNLLNLGIDVRSEGALAMLPPSSGYRWISKGKRGRLPRSILPSVEMPAPRPFPLSDCDQQDVIRRTTAYLRKLPIAISGEYGHRRAYRAACCIADRLSHLMTPEQALPIMEAWNQNCEPPWSTTELLSKLRSAWQR